MAHEPQKLVTTVLSPACAVRLTKVTMAQEYVLLQLTATAPTARCPRCAMPSSSVHSRYQRRLTDLPWGARPVRIQLTVRKFVASIRAASAASSRSACRILWRHTPATPRG